MIPGSSGGKLGTALSDEIAAGSSPMSSFWIYAKRRFNIVIVELTLQLTKDALEAFKMFRVIRPGRKPVLEKFGWTGGNGVKAARRRSEGPDVDASI